MSAAAPRRTGRLAGRRIVATRPAGQNERLAALIAGEGGEAIVFPAIAIADVADPAALHAVAARLDSYDLAVFVSANAVERAMAALLRGRGWPAHLRAATVGPATVRALERHGVTGVVAPAERFDSEALLDAPELAEMTGRRVVVFRGEGGRELLGETLAARGASVEHVACYRRVRPDADPAPLLDHWGRGEVDAVTVTSSEGMHNLYEMLGKLGQAWLKRTPLFAPHERIAAAARALGCERVVATPPADEGLCAGLVAFWERIPPADEDAGSAAAPGDHASRH